MVLIANPKIQAVLHDILMGAKKILEFEMPIGSSTKATKADLGASKKACSTSPVTVATIDWVGK